MDILAARKKAAELAKAGKTAPDERKLPAEELTELPEQAPQLPPLPDTQFLPEEVLPAQAETPGKPADPGPAEAPEEPAGTGASVRDEAEEPTAQEDPGERHEADESEAAEGPEEPLERESEMLAFVLGSEEYVVPVDQVQEVLTPREITPVPHSKEFVLGVCSLRGIVLPIIDLHRRLGLPEAARDDRSRILVMNLGPDDRIGLFVDRVRGVVRFPPSAVRPVPETIEQGAEFLQGIARRDDRMLILLDVEKTTEI